MSFHPANEPDRPSPALVRRGMIVSNKKWREFWIDKIGFTATEVACDEFEHIHVIEYSDFQKCQAEKESLEKLLYERDQRIDQLKQQLSVAKAALNKIVSETKESDAEWIDNVFDSVERSLKQIEDVGK
jgi:hypothetical protein